MYEYKAIITDVYDGDTFTFEVDLGFSIKVKEKIRLYGINTPEIRGKDKVRGKEVRDHVRGLILGKKVKIQVYKKGKFGRYVADVWFNSGTQEIGDELYDTDLSKYLLDNKMGKEFMR